MAVLATDRVAKVGQPSVTYTLAMHGAMYTLALSLPQGYAHCSHSQGTTVTPEWGKSRGS